MYDTMFCLIVKGVTTMVKMVLFLFIMTAALYAQWEIKSPKFFGINFRSINFTDNSNGWVITSEGKLLKSTDSGDTWMPSYDDPLIKIHSMFFADNEYGWLIDSTNTLLLKTTNGGNTWSSSSGQFKKLHFISRETGFAVSQVSDTLAYILKTTDGGNNWDTIVSNRGFNNLYFYDENLGFAVNGHLFWRTADGGNNWSIDTLDNFECPFFYDVSNIQFIDAETGFYTKRSSGEENDSIFCSAFTVLSATTDGGETWKNVDVIPNGSIVKFFNKLEGIFTVNNYNNGGRVYRTTDGGYSWKYSGATAEMDRFTYPLDLDITNNGFVFIAGTNGLLLRSEDFGVNWASVNGPSSLLRGYFFDENTGWAWTLFSVFKSTNGGE
jgi:photosystem II stability/assembly factor-like uncharacterized protein